MHIWKYALINSPKTDKVYETIFHFCKSKLTSAEGCMCLYLIIKASNLETPKLSAAFPKYRSLMWNS